MPRQRRSFRTDDRAIEGLPIRLVIALVVGVASLGVMMGMLGPLGSPMPKEVDVEPKTNEISPGEQELTLTVVDADGQPVADATVVVTSGTATLEEGPQTATTGEDGTATLTVSPTLGANQNMGTLEVEIKALGSQYKDDHPNTEILVTEN